MAKLVLTQQWYVFWFVVPVRKRQPHRNIFTQWGVISFNKTENGLVSMRRAAGSGQRFTWRLMKMKSATTAA